jgi:hypothetical protein
MEPWTRHKFGVRSGQDHKYVTILLKTPIFNECKTWSLALREGHRLKAPENRVSRRIFENLVPFPKGRTQIEGA